MPNSATYFSGVKSSEDPGKSLTSLWRSGYKRWKFSTVASFGSMSLKASTAFCNTQSPVASLLIQAEAVILWPTCFLATSFGVLYRLRWYSFHSTRPTDILQVGSAFSFFFGCAAASRPCEKNFALPFLLLRKGLEFFCST